MNVRILGTRWNVLSLSLVCLLGACSTGPKRTQQHVAARPEPAPPKVGSPINAFATLLYLEREGSNLVHQGKAKTNLLAQTPPSTSRLRLTPPSSQVLSPAQIFQKAEMSVGLVGEFAVKGRTVSFRSFCSGFFITESGAFALCRHSLEGAAGNGYVVMTRDGRLWPVRAVLAAGVTNDVAIIQVEGAEFTPLPVAPPAPVGSPVWVLGHPQGWSYNFTAGMVSGYTGWVTVADDAQTVWMSITADYAVGSSGAPVLNEHGAVVGVASLARTIYSDKDHSPQMVLKLCVPSAAVFDLIQQE